ncbi:MAG TPA: sigma-70 family RNA polymerase sigma factor, partial [Blastocatellia bacterium]
MKSEDARLSRITRSIARLIRTRLHLRARTLVDSISASGYALPDSTSGFQDESKLMNDSSPQEVTRLLQDWRNGDRAALEKLMPLVYDELRRRASGYLRGERNNHTLQATALVHEAYMKMVGYADLEWKNRAHFFGVAARIMRQILIDHARKHRADRRGGGKEDLPLDQAVVFSPDRAVSLIALDDALESLIQFDPLKGRIIELRYFGGLSIEEIGEVESVSVATVRRHMRMGEAWLHREMSKS